MAARSIGPLNVLLGADAAQLLQGLDKAKSGVATWGQAVSKLPGVDLFRSMTKDVNTFMGAFAGGFGGAFVANKGIDQLKGLAGWVKDTASHFQSTANEANKLGLNLGVTSRSLFELRAAAKGAEWDELGKIILRYNIAAGDAKKASDFAALGLKQTAIQGGNTVEVFRNLVKSMEGMNQAQKASWLKDALSLKPDQVMSFMPMFEGGLAGFDKRIKEARETGGLPSQEALDAALRISRLRKARERLWENAKMEIGSATQPQTEWWESAKTSWVKAGANVLRGKTSVWDIFGDAAKIQANLPKGAMHAQQQLDAEARVAEAKEKEARKKDRLDALKEALADPSEKVREQADALKGAFGDNATRRAAEETTARIDALTQAAKGGAITVEQLAAGLKELDPAKADKVGNAFEKLAGVGSKNSADMLRAINKADEIDLANRGRKALSSEEFKGMLYDSTLGQEAAKKAIDAAWNANIRDKDGRVHEERAKQAAIQAARRYAREYTGDAGRGIDALGNILRPDLAKTPGSKFTDDEARRGLEKLREEVYGIDDAAAKYDRRIQDLIKNHQALGGSATDLAYAMRKSHEALAASVGAGPTPLEQFYEKVRKIQSLGDRLTPDERARALSGAFGGLNVPDNPRLLPSAVTRFSQEAANAEARFRMGYDRPQEMTAERMRELLQRANEIQLAQLAEARRAADAMASLGVI